MPDQVPEPTDQYIAALQAPVRGAYPPELRQEAFTRFLDAFEQSGNMTKAAQVAGIPRQSIYDWSAKYPDFKQALDDAREGYRDVLRQEIHNRAVVGEERNIYDRSGQLVETVRQKSDLLLIFHSKAWMPEYRDKLAGDTNVQINIVRGGPDLGV